MLGVNAPLVSILCADFDNVLFPDVDFFPFFSKDNDAALFPSATTDLSFFFLLFDVIEDILSSPIDFDFDFLSMEVIDEMLSSKFVDFFVDGFNFFVVKATSSLSLAIVLGNNTLPFFIMLS